MDLLKLAIAKPRPTDIVGYGICAWILLGYLGMWIANVWLYPSTPEPLNIFASMSMLFLPNSLVWLLPGVTLDRAIPLALLGPIDLAFMFALIRFKPFAELRPAWKLWIYLVVSAAISYVVVKIFFNYMFLQPTLSNAAHRM